MKRDSIETFDSKYKTDSICPRSGMWICSEHPVIEEAVSKGDYFPKCRQRGHTATWWLLNP
jgi:hypothetical protein